MLKTAILSTVVMKQYYDFSADRDHLPSPPWQHLTAYTTSISAVSYQHQEMHILVMLAVGHCYMNL